MFAVLLVSSCQVLIVIQELPGNVSFPFERSFELLCGLSFLRGGVVTARVEQRVEVKIGEVRRKRVTVMEGLKEHLEVLREHNEVQGHPKIELTQRLLDLRHRRKDFIYQK